VTDQPEKLDLRSQDIAEDKVQELLRLFPEIRTEGGRLDFDRLKLALGEAVDVGRERYGMNWPGKADCFRTIQMPSLGTLRPCPEESVNFDATENLSIEGDNLEVLKLLQKSYLGKIKMIYIDPPYNTGNDFIYPDNYAESLQTYLEYTGQVDAEGRKFSTNTEADGRFHSKWMNMMYPRLYLARNLLRDKGFVFVTIDDQEVHHLRLMMNEVFGEENFVANVVWQKKYTRANDAKWFSDNHDHILVFARDKDAARLNLLPRSEEQTAAYSNPDGHPKGPWKATPLHAKSGSNRAPYSFANGIAWAPSVGTFRRYSDDTMALMEAGDEIWFGEDLGATPARKSFLSEVKSGVTPVTIWPFEDVGHNHEANSELKELMGEGIFDNPKPTRLIRRMLELTTDGQGEDIILDFFAGSGTTGHAVLDLNKQDGGNRKFILVQLPEPTEREDYPTLSAHDFRAVAAVRLPEVHRRGAERGDPRGRAEEHRDHRGPLPRPLQQPRLRALRHTQARPISRRFETDRRVGVPLIRELEAS
jgi:adenine-specific DNA-methyltransferase